MKRLYRLRHNSEFRRIRQIGKSYASPLMVLAFLRNELDYSRFGFVVSKHLGKAVRRNQVKRRMREAARLRLDKIKPGFDLVFIARKAAGQASYQEIAKALDYLLESAKLLV